MHCTGWHKVTNRHRTGSRMGGPQVCLRTSDGQVCLDHTKQGLGKSWGPYNVRGVSPAGFWGLPTGQDLKAPAKTTASRYPAHHGFEGPHIHHGFKGLPEATALRIPLSTTALTAFTLCEMRGPGRLCSWVTWWSLYAKRLVLAALREQMAGGGWEVGRRREAGRWVRRPPP